MTETAKVRELSEKDVMTVLDMLRKEFNVDERRIYIMGHSMGGSGTLFLGAKHAAVWAAIAAIAAIAADPAPASFENAARRIFAISVFDPSASLMIVTPV